MITDVHFILAARTALLDAYLDAQATVAEMGLTLLPSSVTVKPTRGATRVDTDLPATIDEAAIALDVERLTITLYVGGRGMEMQVVEPRSDTHAAEFEIRVGDLVDIDGTRKLASWGEPSRQIAVWSDAEAQRQPGHNVIAAGPIVVLRDEETGQYGIDGNLPASTWGFDRFIAKTTGRPIPKRPPYLA